MHALPPVGSPSSACSGETGRKLQQTGACSLWWESFPVPAEAGLACRERVRRWRPRPLCATQQWRLASKADHSSSEVFLAVEPLTPIPSGCLHTAELLTPVPSACLPAANSSSHPGSALLTPRFSTQPLPALADSCLRLGRPGLIPEEALVEAVLRIPEPAQAEGALA